MIDLDDLENNCKEATYIPKFTGAEMLVLISEIRKLREANGVMKEAVEKASEHWFDPTVDNYACVGCDLEMKEPAVAHCKRCHIQAAKDAITKAAKIMGDE